MADMGNKVEGVESFVPESRTLSTNPRWLSEPIFDSSLSSAIPFDILECQLELNQPTTKSVSKLPFPTRPDISTTPLEKRIRELSDELSSD